MKKCYLLFGIISFPLLANQISLSLRNAPTTQIISYLAEETGKNIVINQNIEGSTTLRLENSNFDNILKSISKINQLALNQENGTYYVNHKKEEENIPNIAKENMIPIQAKLVTKTIKLHYAKASEVIESLTKGSGNFLSEAGYIHFDERSNSLIVKDSTSSIKNIINLIKELDKPTEQIAIEARIVTISSENLQELGVRWGMLTSDNTHHKIGGTLEGNGISSTSNLNVNFPVSGGASAVLQVATINSKVLDLELSALEQENDVEIIASPRLLTTNKKQASIKQGTEIPYVMYDRKSETYDVSFKEAILGLEVTPHISKDNQILLDLVVSQNSQGKSVTTASSGTVAVSIDKQELNSQVFAKHGETIVLGGIFQHLKSKDSDKVPVLGSIPVLKHLFSYKKDQIIKRELVIFVTPYIVKSSDMAVDMKKSKPKERKI